MVYLRRVSFLVVIMAFVLITSILTSKKLAAADVKAGCLPNVTVTSSADGGPGSLRQAILDVCAGGGIDFNLPWPVTITLTNGQLLVDKAMRIEGPGADLLSISSGLPFTRVLHNNSEGLYLAGVTIRDGSTPYYEGDGGGILNTGMLTVTHSIIRNNKADSVLGNVTGGGIANIGGTATVSHSMIISNTAGGGGGVANDAGNMTINNCVLVANYAVEGGAILNEGGTVTINNSTLNSNRTTLGWGGGIDNRDGATLILNYSSLLYNETMTDLGYGGGILNAESTAILNYSTAIPAGKSFGHKRAFAEADRSPFAVRME